MSSGSKEFVLGSKKNGARCRIDVETEFDGTAEVSFTVQRFEKDERTSYEDETFTFPSYRRAQEKALSLAREQVAAGLVLVDSEEDLAGPDEEEAREDQGAFVPEYLHGSFDLRDGRSPHSSNLHDLAGIYGHRTFPGCRLPPVHIATLDLSQISIFPESVRRHGLFHIFYSSHEDCNSWQLNSSVRDSALAFHKDALGRVEIDDFKSYAKPCPGGSVRDVRRGPEWDVYLDPPDPLRFSERGLRVGGYPQWWQTGDWGTCHLCDRKMFFIAEVQSIQCPPGNSGGDQLLNAFLCEQCGAGCLIMQFT